MERTTKGTMKLSAQREKMFSGEQAKPKSKKKLVGNFKTKVSTGSTLLDLAISAGRVHGGGIPGGILVEIFGPNSAGKTVLLCEIAGAVQRQGGQIKFHDPEARLNKQFAQIFDFDTTKRVLYSTPDTVTEVFEDVRGWEPEDDTKINGIFTDSLAALSTNMEMDNKDGDKMGMRRAKEFSEQLRKTCRIITKKNQLMVCSNQVRQNADAGPYAEKFSTTGGQAIGFYASLRIRAKSSEKIKKETTVAGKKVTRVIGIKTEFEIYKSSVWKPYRSAPVYIIFDYGIDNIRANLQFIKDYTKNTVYMVGDTKLDASLEKSILMVERQELEEELEQETITLWMEIESKFDTERAPKQRR